MPLRESTLKIRQFLLKGLERDTDKTIQEAVNQFGISRQSIHRHMTRLVQEGLVESSGDTRGRKYSLKSLLNKRMVVSLSGGGPSEDHVWRSKVRPHVKELLTENGLTIMAYGFQEMFNNVLDHAVATSAVIFLNATAVSVTIIVADNGIGIFKKLQEFFSLEDQRHAILELAKGKLTSDPSRHTGDGIFFTSLMMDEFILASDTISLIRYLDDDWLMKDYHKAVNGTKVAMRLSRDCLRTPKETFDKYAMDDYGFTRTHVPVRMALYEGETLVSRSQARRLLSRVERFKEVVLDFHGVKEIGPAFADEIFRVFQNTHPGVTLTPARATDDVKAMIARALMESGSIQGASLD